VKHSCGSNVFVASNVSLSAAAASSWLSRAWQTPPMCVCVRVGGGGCECVCERESVRVAGARKWPVYTSVMPPSHVIVIVHTLTGTSSHVLL